MRRKPISDRRLLFSLFVISAVFASASCFSSSIIRRPNIILINIDDMGWRDVGFMGSEYYITPHIDALAKGGMIFTNAYASASNCAPSRACLMSGQWTPRHGIYTVNSSERGESKNRKLIPTKNNTILPDSQLILTEALKSAGYITCHAGKWHLNDDPTTQGFDVNVGGCEAGNPGSYYPPYKNVPLDAPSDGYYLTTLIMDKTLEFLDSVDGEPFFLYYSPYAVHTPIQPVKELLSKYENKPAWNEQNNAKYATMVENLDIQIGRLTGKLQKSGKLENTFILFISDNGGFYQVTKQRPLRAGKGSYYEGGIREPMFAYWHGKIRKGTSSDVPVTNLDFYPTILDAAGISKPENKVLDGQSILPLLTKNRPPEERPLYWHFPIYLQGGNSECQDSLFRTRPGSAIRLGDWKLIEYFENNDIELYNLKNDIAEETNLAESNPEKANELLKMLQKWRNETKAPVPSELNPEYEFFDDVINLVPEAPASAPNYWCTWYAQNYWVQRGGELSDLNKITNPAAREELTYNHLYNQEDGWVSNFLPRGRSDWYFLIDHGWQTKEASERIIQGARPFFSLQIDTRDFPVYRDAEPKEALRLFNEEIIANGWRGLGIWTRGTIDSTAAHIMVEWSKYAGIEYWKIDGGGIENFWSYKIKKKIFPELILEYVTGAGGNLNPGWDIPNQNEYPSVYDIGGKEQENMLRVLQNSDAFRTYDATPILMSVTTLRRTHDILKQTHGNPKYTAILNLQDDCNPAAALGCLVASKRHPNFMERTLEGKDLHHQLSGKRHMQGRINEPERFGRWSRIAPAFPAGVGSYHSSEKELIDYYEFSKWDTWNKSTYGKMVFQSAPAVMSRNMPLPKVEIDGEPPYVMASTYPNGPICVATEGRVRPEDSWFHPRAKVTIQVKDATQAIGIFGHYDVLVIEFSEAINPDKIWAQDLLAKSATDITPEIEIEENSITIPGELIDEIGTSAGDEGDISVPGMVLKLKE